MEDRNRPQGTRPQGTRPQGTRPQGTRPQRPGEAPVKKRKKKSKKTVIFNTVIYVLAALLLGFAALILCKEYILCTNDETEGLISESQFYEGNVAVEQFRPLATPVSDYDVIPVKFHFIDKDSSCDIYPVGIDNTNHMETIDSAMDVTWLSVDPYVTPGDIGNAVISGHNLWKSNAGTFSQLKKMRLGEVVGVTFDKGFTRFFEVVDMYECDYNDSAPMVTDINEARLTLITCKGDWNSQLDQSLTRVVVECRLLENYIPED